MRVVVGGGGGVMVGRWRLPWQRGLGLTASCACVVVVMGAPASGPEGCKTNSTGTGRRMDPVMYTGVLIAAVAVSAQEGQMGQRREVGV